MNTPIGKLDFYNLISFTLFSHHFIQTFFFKGAQWEWSICEIPTITLYIEYIKIRVENFHLYLLLMETYAKVKSCKFSS